MNESADLSCTRIEARAGEAKHLVVLVHGYGSSGEQWFERVRPLCGDLPSAAFVAPNAPYALPESVGRYQWRALPAPPGEDGLVGVRASAAWLDHFIDAELARRRLDPSRLAMLAFSQGAMLSMHVAPRRTQCVAGIVAFSGNLVAPELLAHEVRTRPPMLLVRGGADALMPKNVMDDAAFALRGAGFDVETHVVPEVAHAVDERGLALAAGFLRRVLV